MEGLAARSDAASRVERPFRPPLSRAPRPHSPHAALGTKELKSQGLWKFLDFLSPFPIRLGGGEVPLGVEGTILRTRQEDVMPGMSPSGGGPDYLIFLLAFLIRFGGFRCL